MSTLYGRIERREVKVQYDSAGRTVISAAEVERMARTPELSDVIALAMDHRRCSKGAARQFINRSRKKGLSLDEIISALQERRP